ncbi:MAG: hypothetical protein LBH29_04830 [Elusimicrobiota bacterium]|jgi:predicted helicase|nr:hypothetical protein [Elusimicrobiota bacterium]
MRKNAYNSLNNSAKLIKIKNKVLQDIYGFELQFTPYIISHALLNRYLKNMGAELNANERLGIYLTNTLDIAPHSISDLLPMLKQEQEKSTKIKNETNILAVMGNPPYFNGKSLSQKGLIESEIFQHYKKGLNQKKINLDDIYIKFIRFAERKIEKSGKGIAGIITNNSYLDGETRIKMRQHLYDTFSDIYILNLHGNGRKDKSDKNIFDIMVGVSISFFVKNPDKNKQKKVFYFSTLDNKIFSRAEKLEFLQKTAFKDIKWKIIKPEETEDFEFIPKDSLGEKKYKTFFNLKDIFSVYKSAISTGRDDLVINYEASDLTRNIETAISGNFSNEFKEKYKIENSSGYKVVDRLRKETFEKKHICDISYRIFDRRKIYYRVGFTSRPADPIMKHFLSRKNIGLAVGDKGNIFIFETITDFHYLIGQKGTKAMPLYLYHRDEIANSQNKNPNWTKDFKRKYLSIINFKPSPEEILAYIYAVLHCPFYRKKYRNFFRVKIPSVPMTKDKEIFYQYANLGKRLIEAHLLKNLDDSDAKLECPQNLESFKIYKYEIDGGKLCLFCRDQNGGILPKIYFENCGKDIFNFEIAGYKPIEKYLKYRIKDAVLLEPEVLLHIQKMIVSIKTTVNIIKEIENLKEKYCIAL